jgi:hypothetical protein
VADHLDASESETVRRHAATFRAVRAARLAASEERSDERAHRAMDTPRVPARVASSDEVPPTAQKLVALAEREGWATAVSYSESADGVDAVVVRARRGEDAVLAYWRKRRWASGFAVSDGRFATPAQKGLVAFLLSDGKPGVAAESSDDVEYDATRTGQGGEEDT